MTNRLKLMKKFLMEKKIINRKKDSIGFAVVLILISTLGFSLYPILGRYVFDGGASLVTVVFGRFAIAAVFFWTITIWREGFPRLPLKTWLTLWAMGGIGYSLQAGLYISSIQYIPASMAALLLYAHPMIITVIAVLIKQEVFSRFKFAGLILSTFGLVLVLGLALHGINSFGIILALGAAFIYSIYILIGNNILKTASPLVSTTIISTSAALTYGIIGLPIGGFTWNLSWGTWIGIAGIGVFSTVIAMLTFFEGIKRIGPTSTSIISMTEPLMTVVLAVILLNENLTLLQATGGLFVVIGGILAVISPSRNKLQQVNSSAN